MYKYQVTVFQQFLLLLPLMIAYSIIGCVYLYFFGTTFTSVLYLLGFAFFFLIDILPTIIVHCQYLMKNRKAEFIINTAQQRIIYKTSAKEIEHSFDDVKLMQRYASLCRKTGWYAFAGYRFYRIIFNNCDEIIVTCLMMNKIENIEKILGIESEKNLRLVAFLPKKQVDSQEMLARQNSSRNELK